MNKTKERPWRENIVKLSHRFSLMMQKGKIQRTQNAPNEPCIFLSRERKKNAKKICADILVGKCKASEYRMLPLYRAERKKHLMLPGGVSGRKAHLDSVLSEANNENRLNKMVIQGLEYRERECSDIRSSLLLE